MDSSLSENQELLLFKACKDNNGVVTRDLAERMYSSKSSAKSAIKKLELFDHIEYSAPGVWKVSKIPTDVKQELKQVMDNTETETQKPPEERQESSDFKIKA